MVEKCTEKQEIGYSYLWLRHQSAQENLYRLTDYVGPELCLKSYIDDSDEQLGLRTTASAILVKIKYVLCTDNQGSGDINKDLS